MKTKIISLLALVSGLAAPAALAQTAQPVLTCKIVDIQVTNNTVGSAQVTAGGTAYTVVPTVTLVGGGGIGATAHATIDAGGAVDSVIIDNPGSGYIGPPNVQISGGGVGPPAASGAEATAYLAVTTDFPIPNNPAPNQNEGFGAAGDTIGISALASGTQPSAGFRYGFTVNGQSVGTSIIETPGESGGIYWTPPLPGVYNITATTTDGLGNTATSASIRYFATGTAIVSPVAGGNVGGPGTLVPVGSSLVIEATSTPADGFVQRIDFYTDWTGSTSTSTLIGSGTNYPYSVIYTPTGPSGVTHRIKAVAYDNNGAVVPGVVSMDEILLTMTTANSGPLPTCSIFTPTNGSLLEIPDYGTNASAAVNVIVTAGPGTGSGAHIQRVELYINGVLFGTDTSYPYKFVWQPSVTGAYALTALAYDTLGNVVASTASASSNSPVATNITIESAPAVDIVSPGQGATLNGGAATSITAVASDTNLDMSGNPVTIKQVQFFQDGTFVGVASTPTAGDFYTISFKPVQNMINGAPAPSSLTAIATDTVGFSGNAAAVQVNVTSGGTGSNVVIGTPPTVTLVTPANEANVIVNTPVKLSATGTAPNGNISSMAFLIDNTVVSTLTQYPYSATYTFQNLGTYQLVAQVVDNVGDETSTKAITINVVPEPPPTVSVTAPASGGIITAAAGVTVTATASSPSGTIANVQFFENNISIGTATTAPYTASFTPLSAGVYTLTAVATDNAGEQTTSAPSIVEAVQSTGGLGTSIYRGTYQGASYSDRGYFAFIVVDGLYGTYISHSDTTVAPPSTAFYSDLKVSTGGAFSLAGKLQNCVAGVSGVQGTLLPGQELFIGAATQPNGQSVATGYYTGNLAGQAGSAVTGILGADGSLMLYISSGSFSDVADGSVDASGAYTITTVGNNTVTGKVDPVTGFLTGALSGTPGGSLLAARVSGGTFSDGVLRNISTRGQVGTGGNIMIAGFVVGGTSPKTLLIRAVGPTLSSFGVSGAITGTSLNVYSGTTVAAQNTGWSSNPTNAAAVANAEPQVGAFALPSGSFDSALVGTFAPGPYTAQVSGLNGATGTALVEIYDLDTYTPFTPQKLIDVSTRGTVGSGSNVMIGGFEINGAAPKRLLIRGAGPGLTALGVTNALASAHLQLINSTNQSVIRENYSWGTGNDLALVTAAEQATGAFPYATGSADSAILIVLPPGTYTAVLSGTGSSTGTALVEVYEVP